MLAADTLALAADEVREHGPGDLRARYKEECGMRGDGTWGHARGAVAVGAVLAE